MDTKYTHPSDIEVRSMQIIESEMTTAPDPLHLNIIKRVIHTTADFDYERTLRFSDGAVDRALDAIASGATFVTDTNMSLAGINKAALAAHSCDAVCFMADEDVAAEAKSRGVTRAIVSMEKAARLAARSQRPFIFAIGNAPTALLRISELAGSGEISPALVIGVPVGFVNVVESKEIFMHDVKNVPYIINEGRKGGSTVAAAICNALLYMR